MVWLSFLGAFFGVIFAILVAILAFAIWDFYDRRKPNGTTQNTRTRSSKTPLNDILERQLESYIVEHYNELFPGWKIVDVEAEAATKKVKPSGVRRRTDGGGEIDILCTDEHNNFVVLELKRDRASDKVASQIDRYIAWVKQNLAQPNQQVRGIIIAKRFDTFLALTLSERKGVDLWLYDWQLILKPVSNKQARASGEDSDYDPKESD